MNNKIIGFIIISGALLLGWTKKQLNRISIGDAQSRIHKVNLNGLEIHTDLQIINSSDATIDVTAFLGQLYYGNSAMGTVHQASPVSIPPFTTDSVQYVCNISWLGAGSQLYNAYQSVFTNSQLTIQQKVQAFISKFRIKGTVKAEGLSIDIDQQLLA
jgi:LEA14-like dessication related protein